jgi:hypothetical protein
LQHSQRRCLLQGLPKNARLDEPTGVLKRAALKGASKAAVMASSMAMACAW